MKKGKIIILDYCPVMGCRYLFNEIKKSNNGRKGQKRSNKIDRYKI